MENYKEQELFALGVKAARADVLKDVKRDLSKYPPAFVKGYKEIARDSWWYKMNNKITDLLARMGSSRLR